jgi:DNA-binding MarR family transcriptional regulator
MLFPSSPFLEFSKSTRKINKRYKINDCKELLVLEAVLGAYSDGVEFSVLDLILLGDIASQATLHSIMKTLILKKMIKTETCKRDARRKYVLPTRQGLSWLKDKDELLVASQNR